MEKLKMQSSDVVGGNVAKIAALFPQCVTERLNKDGKPELAIDFDKLRAELSTDVLDDGEERYQFTWPDKRAASHLANEATDKTLRPDIDSSVDFWNTQNLYIEGDNLDVLKILREDYLGKVKMIYIDPPYNTGNDFVYNDDFSQSYDDWSRDTRSCVRDEEGNQLLDPMQRNTESNGRFHTDWLNMMYPRLKVARDLLAEDGVIFISMDDNEIENLRKICDEIFGEENFEACVMWRRRTNQPNDKSKMIAKVAEFILVYAKNCNFLTLNKAFNGVPLSEERVAGYSNPDNDPNGAWSTNPWKTATGRGGTYYRIVTPTGKAYDETWYGNEATFAKLLSQNRVHWTDNGNGVPRIKIYLKDALKEGQAAINFFTCEKFGSNQEGSSEIDNLFRTKGIFDNPKPVRLLKALSNLASMEDSIVLDFFSGSATTAHAVMKLNAEDGGKRKFIMVQLPEITDEKSEARKAGFETICQIGEERIRRAGKKILEEVRKEKRAVSSDNLFAEDNSSLITSNSSLPDVGFRVLKLDSSNMEDVYYSPEDFDEQNLFNTVDNVKSDRTPLDLLFQVMPELNIQLSSKIEEKEVNGKKVFFVDGNYLIATFDTDVNESTVTEIAKLKPQYFVMRDASAANDNVLDNFEQIFKHYSPGTTCRVI